ncbi:unnamed protein product [Closterium sp. NIES-53]
MDSRTGEHLATFTRRPRLSSAPPSWPPLLATPAWHALPSPCVWSTQVPAPAPEVVCTALPSLCRGAAAPHSSLLVSSYHCSSADPAHGRADVRGVLIHWIRAVHLQLRTRFQQDLPDLRLHSDRGGEFCSRLLEDFRGAEGIVARTSMIHAASPHFLWQIAVRYAAEQLNLYPMTSPTLWWTGEVGDASAFLFYHPGSRRMLSSRDVTFHESVCFYCLHPHRSSPVPLRPLSVVDDPPPPPGSPPPSSQTCSLGCISGGGTTGGAGSRGAGSGVAECTLGTRGPGGTGAGGSATRRQEALSPERIREWAVQWGSPGGGASRLRVRGAGNAGAGGAGTAGAGGSAAGGTGVASAGGTGARRQETLSLERLCEWAVQWGSPGGGASRARSPQAGGTGGAAAVGTAAGSSGGGAGRAGAAYSEGASPGGASAGVPRTGGT